MAPCEPIKEGPLPERLRTDMRFREYEIRTRHKCQRDPMSDGLTAFEWSVYAAD